MVIVDFTYPQAPGSHVNPMNLEASMRVSPRFQHLGIIILGRDGSMSGGPKACRSRPASSYNTARLQPLARRFPVCCSLMAAPC